MTDYALARFNMVEGQVKPNKVTDEALMNAMMNVPRHLFVPKSVQGIAHVDEDIAIGHDRYLMEPMVFGRLINELAILPSDVVLDIGCAYGYSAAVLSRLAGTVVALESDPELVRAATERLARESADNAVVVEAPLTEGYPRQAPYNAILINGAVHQVPQVILDQIAVGGRLAVVEAAPGSVGRGVIYHRFGDVVSRRDLFDANTPYLPGFEPKPAFEF